MNSHDFVICTRNRKGKSFGTNPGDTTFLLVPHGETPNLNHKAVKEQWVQQLIRDATLRPNAPSGEAAGDVLIFVHGYNNSQKLVMRRHRMLQGGLKKLGFEGVVVSFDWPSAESALNYLDDRTDAKETAIRLVDDGVALLAQQQSAGCKLNAHVLAHSTGAFVVREACDDADDRRNLAAQNWTISQLMFIAADISSGSLSASDSKSQAMFRHCVRLTNYWNPYDSVLQVSNAKRLGMAPRVGRVGLPEDSPASTVDVDCGERFQAVTKNRTNQGMAYGHSWYFDDPVFMKDLFYTVQGHIDRNRIPTRKAVKDNDLVLVSQGTDLRD